MPSPPKILGRAFDEADDEQQDHSTDCRADDLCDQTTAEHRTKQHSGNYRTDDTDNDIPDEAKASAHNLPCEPTGNRTNSKHDDNSNGIHVVSFDLTGRMKLAVAVNLSKTMPGKLFNDFSEGLSGKPDLNCITESQIAKIEA